MSLNSSRLPEKYRSGRVFIPKGEQHSFDFIPFVAMSVTSGQAEVILKPFEDLYSGNSEVMLIRAVGDVNMRAKMLISLVSMELRTNPNKLTAYILFDCAESCKEYDCEKVTFDVADDKFFVLVATDDACIIIAREEDVHISKDTPLHRTMSDNMCHVLTTKKGFHTYNEGSSPIISFASMLERETIELGNTSIYSYLTDNYSCIADMHIPITSDMSEDLCSYLNSRIIAALSDLYKCDFGLMPCCWVCDTEAAVDNYYIAPFEDMPKDICVVDFSGKLFPMCDLGAQGCLIAANEIQVRRITKDAESKSSVFSQEIEKSYTLMGIPVIEDGPALAVDLESFVSKCNHYPTDSDRSGTYRDLFILRDVPVADIWDQCRDSSRLYKIVLDRYGVKKITVSDIRTERR